MALAALLGGLVLSGSAFAQTVQVATAPHPCNVSLEQARLSQPLTRVSHRLAGGLPITIVAIGSSSTAGAGASTPANNYPNRLAADLAQRFPRQPITVINRGVNGEEINDMLSRLDTQVLAEKPDLVIWQLGTNSVLRDRSAGDYGERISDGLARIRAAGADVVMVDPQFAPKVIAKGEASTAMVELISTVGKKEGVSVFHRFAVMQRWSEVEKMPFDTFVSPDGLHMNDWSYACIAKALGAGIAEAATRPVAQATAAPANSARQ